MKQTFALALAVAGFCLALGSGDDEEHSVEYLISKGYSQEEDPRCYGETGNFPIVDDCTHYLRCVQGRSKIKQCPGNLHFDRYEYCTQPHKAECETSDSDRSEPIIVCPQVYGYFIYPDDCTKYVVCHNSRPRVESCPEGKNYHQHHGCYDGPCVIIPDEEKYMVKIRDRID